MVEKETRGGGASAGEPAASVVRPALQVWLDAVVVPALFCAADGQVVMHNVSATPFLTHRPDTPPRLHVHDGTDLWIVISARCDDASPFFDLHAKVRVADGQVSDVTLFVAPTRGPGGSLSGALILVLDALATRVRGMAAVDAGSPSGGLAALVQRLGVLTGAAHTYVVEYERGFGSEAQVIASWAVGDVAVPLGPFDVRNTPSDSFNGKRFTCIPRGLQEAYGSEPFFREHGSDAYAGVVLLDPSGTQIGVMAALWNDPIQDVPGVSAVFSVTAVWAARLLGDLLAQRDLKESEQRYAAVFEGSAVPILLVDPETTQIVDANPAACEFYGHDRDELMTMSVLQADALSAEMVRAELARAAEGTRTRFASKQLLSEGRLRDVEINVGPIRVGGRQVLYSMVHDITDRKRMESEIQRAKRGLETLVGQRTQDLLRTNAELQQASIARDMVFASLAREMRTSLQTITGFSDVLLSGMAGDLSAEARRQVEMIAEAGRQLSGFASTLLESRGADGGTETIDPEEFDLVGLVESVLFGLGSFADEKDLSLRFVAEERPIDIVTDRFICQQILLNLLSNAIRYTDRGSVTVTVSRMGDRHCSVAVADTGPGISRDRIETLFQGPEVRPPAAGIGLPASLRTAGVLHGTIDVQSALGSGSVFSLVLPLSITDEAQPAS